MKHGKNSVNIEELHKPGYAENAPNYGVILNLVSTKIFCTHKFLCVDWDVYSRDQHSVCRQTKGLVVYPLDCREEEGGKKKYWEDSSTSTYDQ